MKVVKLLLRSSPGGFAVAAIIGALGGFAGSSLLHGMTRGMREPTLELGLAFAAVIAFQIALAVGSHAILSRLGAHLIGGLRLRIARAALTAPYPQLEKIGLPRIRAAIIEDASAIGSVTGTLVGALVAAATLVGGFAYLAWLSPAAAVSTVVLALIAWRAYRKLAALGMKGVMTAFRKRGRLYEDFQGVILGATEVRLHERRRNAVLEDAKDASSDFHAEMSRGVSYNYAAEAVGQTALFLGVAAAVAALAAFGARGASGIILAVVFMQTPLFVLLSAGPRVNEANAVAEQLEELLGLFSADLDVKPPPESTTKKFESLELTDVRFKYPNAPEGFDIGPINLRLEPGEIVYLTGGNGSGKTTLAKVLVGLYAPEGRVTLDGKPVESDDDREAYRDRFAVVYSDGYVFPELWGTAREKLDERANALLEELQLGKKVEVKGGRLSSTRLSQGQKKRLALLSAYLEDRPIFLFDEWAADQDPNFKRLFYTKYLPELKAAGKSAIVISHDDRYFHLADRVIRMERGRMVDAEPVESAVVPA